MKYLDRIGLVGAVNTVLVTCIPYFAVFLNLSDDVKTRTEQIILLSTIVALSLITLFVSRRYTRNVARVEGFAWGYFYNFVYELADLIIDKEAEITINGNKVDEQTKIKLLIIIPNDLHAEYKIAELISTVFNEAVITPGANSFFPMRRKAMKALEVNKDGEKYVVLIDTPPTTMRAIKLYQESCCNIDHNDAFDDLDKKLKKEFNKICIHGRKNIAPKFKNALEEIIENISKGSRRQEHKALISILTLDQVMDGIISKGEYERLTFIGDNLREGSKAEKNKVLKIINQRKDELINKVREIA
ncbi:MAG: hypothetical protein JNK79_15945 [Chitinophagaceae bacterium]|nr:hypothetical protein [Chitinophagaceae bacterium]